MRYRSSWGRVVVVEPSTAMLCRTSLLTLVTLQLTEAEEDQEKTWMKTGHTPHLQYLLIWKKDPGYTPPFPKPHPCIKGQDSKLFQISQMYLRKNSHSCPRPDIIITCACQGEGASENHRWTRCGETGWALLCQFGLGEGLR